MVYCQNEAAADVGRSQNQYGLKPQYYVAICTCSIPLISFLSFVANDLFPFLCPTRNEIKSKNHIRQTIMWLPAQFFAFKRGLYFAFLIGENRKEYIIYK